jgi:hypothetical protein
MLLNEIFWWNERQLVSNYKSLVFCRKMIAWKKIFEIINTIVILFQGVPKIK